MQTAGAEVWPQKARSFLLIFFALLLFSTSNFSQTAARRAGSGPLGENLEPLPQDTGVNGLELELRRLQNTGRLMMVVAHPDDEDGGLLTLESRGKGVHVLLQTLTRGEGGQNKTGDTFSDELGLLRTMELLAADRYYGVEQRFTRVADFGYSKTPEETFQKWGGHDVPLQDIVHVIREFRPDVLIARFSGTDRDGHGHHQASSILAQEAFRAAADPNRFPEQIKAGLQPWQPKKLYVGNVCGFGASSCPDENWTVKINTGEDDSLLGMSYVQFAVEGLRHQESQGLGDLRAQSGPRYAFYKLADSVLQKTTDASGHEKDLFDGIDTSVAGLLNGKNDGEVKRAREAADKLSEAVKAADTKSESAVAPLLAALELLNGETGFDQKSSDGQTTAVKLRDKEEQARTAIDLALNVELTASLISPDSSNDHKELTAISPGQNFAVRVTFHNGSSHPLQLNDLAIEGEVTDHGSAVDDQAKQRPVAPGQNYEHTFQLRLPDAPFTKTGFHRDDPQRDAVYTVNQPKLITLPFATTPPAIVRARFDVGDVPPLISRAERTAANLPEISSPIAVPVTNAGGVQRKEELAVVPAFSVGIDPGNQVVPTSNTSPIDITVKVSSNLDGAQSGSLRLQAPPNSQISPAQQPVSFSQRGEEKVFQFKVTLPPHTPGQVALRAVLSSGNKVFSEGYKLVRREDLGSFYYFQPAAQHVSYVEVKVPRDLKVGYIMGAGDDIATVLKQVGVNVTLIPADKIAAENLSQYGTIVLGVRAYDTHKELVANNQKLLDFVSNGGTLIVQNNNSVSDFNSEHLTPYPTELSRARVSVEEAPVTILAPNDPIFHRPNEISQKDFEGWVQERGIYFMSTWDAHFQPLLSCHDPNEADQKGGMLVAKYGKGLYIYSGYAFFRQLPAGVPGAIRLFVNLVSAGHQP